MGINDWPEQDHPRERLIARGPRALSNAELLAVLLRVGVKDVSAVPLAETMIMHFGSLNAMFNASLTEFSRINGLGPAKFAQLQAVMELAQRAIGEQLQSSQTLGLPEAVKLFLRMTLFDVVTCEAPMGEISFTMASRHGVKERVVRAAVMGPACGTGRWQRQCRHRYLHRGEGIGCASRDQTS